MAIYAGILALGIVAGGLSGIVGTGSSILLLPVLVFAFGPQQAAPIMAIAAFMGNIAKAASWWREVDWRAFLAYSISGGIGAALGARTLILLPANTAELLLGLFFLLMIPGRLFLKSRDLSLGTAGLFVAGAVIGFVNGIVLSTGPLSIPVFSAYGLAKGALISTEAMSSLLIGLSKIFAFYKLGAVTAETLLRGLLVGSTVMLGSFGAKSLLVRMSAAQFERTLDVMLLVAGLSMLGAALT